VQPFIPKYLKTYMYIIYANEKQVFKNPSVTNVSHNTIQWMENQRYNVIIKGDITHHHIA